MTHLDIVKAKLRNSYALFSDNSELLTDVEWIGKGIYLNYPYAYDMIKSELSDGSIIWHTDIDNRFPIRFTIKKGKNGGIHITTPYPTECFRMLCAFGFYGFNVICVDEYLVNGKCVYPLDGYETKIFYDEYFHRV